MRASRGDHHTTLGRTQPRAPIHQPFSCALLLEPAIIIQVEYQHHPLTQVLLLQLVAHLLWKHCVNRTYYARRNQMRRQVRTMLAARTP